MRGMIPHHQGGVAMCAVLLHYNAAATVDVDEELVVLCHHVIGDQSREVGYMQNFLGAKYGLTGGAPCA